jgi:hypothetical protein
MAGIPGMVGLGAGTLVGIVVGARALGDGNTGLVVGVTVGGPESGGGNKETWGGMVVEDGPDAADAVGAGVIATVAGGL